MSDSYDDYESGTLTGRYQRAAESDSGWVCDTCESKVEVYLYRGGKKYCAKHAPDSVNLSPQPSEHSAPAKASKDTL